MTLETLVKSFEVALLSENKSPRTIETYLESLGIFKAWLTDNGHPLDIEKIDKGHIRAFVDSLLKKGNKPSTASNRYRALKTFFKWAVADDELSTSPMETLKPPRVPETPPPVLSDSEIQSLLKACEGKAFAERRDMAIIRLFLDTGMRRAELAGLMLADVDIINGTAVVMGKGHKLRNCPFGHKTAQALDRYIRSRSVHPDGFRPELWLGSRGPLTDWGIDGRVRARGEIAGVSIHLHQLRHSWAHLCQLNGMPESALMTNAGWSSRQMVDRYAKSAASERAKDAHRLYGPGDRF